MHSLLVVIEALPAILPGILVTVGNVAVSLAMGLALGVPFAVAQVYGPAWSRRLVRLYVWFFRGVPILVLLFLFYGFFISLGLPADPLSSPVWCWAAPARPTSRNSSGGPSKACPGASCSPPGRWA